MTSYRSQGTTSEESLLVLGEVASRALGRREFYVGNTRYRGAHAIYVSRKHEILRRLGQPDIGRELASEFIERQGMAEQEQPGLRRMRHREAQRRVAWLHAVEMQRRRENYGVKQSL